MHEFQVFICGFEEVKVVKELSDIKIRYWWDNVNTITANMILKSFKSDLERCPVV